MINNSSYGWRNSRGTAKTVATSRGGCSLDPELQTSQVAMRQQQLARELAQQLPVWLPLQKEQLVLILLPEEHSLFTCK